MRALRASGREDQGIGPRSILRFITFLAAVGLLVATGLGRLRVVAWPFELLSNLPLQLLILAVVLAVASALVRARITAVICALAIIVNGAAFASVVRRSAPPARVAASGPTLVIGHLNAQSGSIDVAALRRMLRTRKPDVFVVLEPSQTNVHALQHDAAGYQVTTTATHASAWVRTVVLSRVPITDVMHVSGPNLPPATVRYTVHLPGIAVEVLALHTESPTTPARAGARNRALNAAAHWARRQTDPTIVMGDFNTTPWSPVFNDFVHTSGLRNSLNGFGQQSSWPAVWGWAGVPIDQALLSPSLVTVRRATSDDFGSSHRSLLLTFGQRAPA